MPALTWPTHFFLPSSLVQVRYYGSFSSNTYLPVSDIDMVVIVPKENNVVAVLFEVAYLLFIDGIIEKHCSIIPHSRIPLLKFYDCMTGFQINITINTPNVMERAEYIRQSFFPKGIRHGNKAASAQTSGQYELKILYFMKYYLLYRNSNQVYFGGIGSYALSLMVLRYFQEKETVELISRAANGTAATAATAAAERSSTHTADDGDEGEGEVEGDDVGSSSSSSSGGIGQSSLLGRLLIGFLQRYSDVDFISKVTISVRDGGAYRPSPPVVASQPHYQLHHHHHQQQQLMNMSGGSSTFSSDGSSSAAADVLPQQQVGNIGGGGVKHPASHFAGHYLNKKCSVLRIEDPREPWKNVSAGSFNSDLILADFGRLLQALLHPKEAGGGLHGLYEDGQNQWSIIANGLTVVDSFVEYRTILKDIYRVSYFNARVALLLILYLFSPRQFWFPTVPKQSPSQSSPRPVNELYESFIQQRNIFGPRHIEFEYKRLEDNTAQLVLMDTQVPGVQGRPPPHHYHHHHHNQHQQQHPNHGHGHHHNNNNAHHHRQQYQHQQPQNYHHPLNSNSSSYSSGGGGHDGNEHSQQGGGGYGKHQANGGGNYYHHHHHHHNNQQQHYMKKKKSCSVLRLDTGGGGGGTAAPQQWNTVPSNNNSRSSGGGGGGSAHNNNNNVSVVANGGGAGSTDSSSDRKTRELKKILKIDFN